MGQSRKGPISSHGRCPVCGAPGEAGLRPFCSRRCADVDLSRWLRGAYAIPGGHGDVDEDGDDARASSQAVPGEKGLSDADE